MRVRPTSVALFAVGAAAVLYATARFGPGASADSATYLSVARSLAHGDGFVRFDGHGYHSWPPLYPLLLAPLIALGLDAPDAARAIGAICAGLTLAATGRILRDRGRPPALAVFLLLIPALRMTLASAWSEAPMIAATSLGFAAARPLPRAVAGAAAVLSRYVGLAAAIAFAPTRPRALLAYAPAVLLPLVAWVSVHHESTRHAASVSFADNAADLLRTLGGTLGLHGELALAAGLLPFLLLVGGDRRLRAFIALYTTVLLASSSWTAVSYLGTRFAAPLIPAFFVLVIDRLPRLPSPSPWRRLALPIVLTALTLYGLHDLHEKGVYGYSRASWYRSALLADLRERPPLRVLSNHPHAVALYTSARVDYAPQSHPYRSKAVDLDPIAQLRHATRAGPVHLAWFNRKATGYFFLPPASIAAAGFVVEPVATWKDGTLYRVEAPAQ